MITTERISAWLQEPHHLQELAPKALAQFVKEYPYFSPAHYFKFMGIQQDDDTLFRLQQLHPVHPVLLNYLIMASSQPEIYQMAARGTTQTQDDFLIQPASADDYFRQQGIEVSTEWPDVKEISPEHEPEIITEEDKEKALMVVMSFAEWLYHISSKNQKAKEEEAEQKALKTMWQQQKLAAAIQEESEEIPEQVFEMAVNSISRKDELVSESLAEVYAKQGKKEKAIEMYQKLSLLNPEKNTYFAARIEKLQKDL